MKPLSAFLACAAALLFAACDSQPTMQETLPADAAAELHELLETVLPAAKEEDREVADLIDLLEEYDKTGNAALRGEPNDMTPLHLAVMYRREALVRELLRQGADPNATMRTSEELRESIPELPAEMDAPIVWAVVAGWGLEPEKNTVEISLRLIDMLVEAGADAKGAAGGHALLMSTVGSEEAVYVRLLELGADPGLGYLPNRQQDAAIHLALRNGWRRAAEHLKAAGRLEIDKRFVHCTMQEEGEEEWKQWHTLLYNVVRALRYSEGTNEGISQQAREGIRLVLELGADVNAPHQQYPNSDITTPLLAALEQLPPEDAPQACIEAYGWLLQQLLQHGGDLNTRYPKERFEPRLSNKTAADIIRAHAPIAQWLAEHGCPLPPASEAQPTP